MIYGIRDYLVDLLNSVCGVPAGIRQLADLSGDYGKAFSRFPGPGCLQGGVQGNQSGL